MESSEFTAEQVTLFFDQNIGPSVPRTLKARGLRDFEYRFLLDVYPNALRPGKYVDDTEWLRDAGVNGWLAITRDLRILTRPDQRQALIDSEARVVFLDAGNAPRRALTEWVIRNSDWLLRVYKETPPPFAFVMTLDGAPRRVDLSL